jgi:hypothetical protein
LAEYIVVGEFLLVLHAGLVFTIILLVLEKGIERWKSGRDKE